MGNDGILLAYARNRDTNELVHISKADGKIEWECPECGGIVHKRAGNIRRHHFAHTKGASCSISYETNLHMGAKIFLRDQLREDREILILLGAEFLPDSPLKEFLKKADIPQFCLPKRNLLENPMCHHELEKGVGDYVADVLSSDPTGIKMAWEVCVSNPISPEKRQFLEGNQVPFIELEPTEKGEEGYLFEVRSWGNIKSFSPEDFSLRSLTKVFAKELQTWVASDVLRYFLEHAHEIMTEKLLSDVNGSVNPQNPWKPTKEVIREFFANQGSLRVVQSYEKGITKKTGEEVVENLQLHSGERGVNVRFNKVAFMDSPLNLAGEFLINFARSYSLMGWANENGEIVGISGNFFTRSLKEQKFTKRLSEPGTRLAMVNLQFCKIRWQETPGYMEFCLEMAPDEPRMILKQHQELLLLLLEEIRTHTPLKILCGINKKGYKCVYGISFDGLYSSKRFHEEMLNHFTGEMKAILFPEVPPTKR